MNDRAITQYSSDESPATPLATGQQSKFDYIIGLDNGSSANGVALFRPETVLYVKLPIKRELSYTKTESHITRVDVPKFRALLASWNLPKDKTIVMMEKPFTNFRRFKTTMAAMRSLEAELIVIEEFEFYLRYVVSSEWQSELLPGVTGSEALKAASLALGKKLFPQFKLSRDADSLLIGYWAKYGGKKSKHTKTL